MDHNVKYDVADISVVRNDTIDLSYSVKLNGVAYDMTGKQIDMVIKDSSGTAVKTLSTIGTSPAITISTSTLRVQTSAIIIAGKYKYDIQLTSGSTVMTIQKGIIIVEEDVT
jgi:hypothetical protein